MRSKKKMYFADLTYNSGGVIACDFVPLGCGYVAAYAKERFGDEYDVEIFKFADEMLEAMAETPPAVLGGSCNVWNRNLLLKSCAIVRERYPSCLIVLGGTAFPLDPQRQRQFLAANPQIDCLIPYDGELAFADSIDAWHAMGCDRQALRRAPLETAVTPDGDGELRTALFRRPKILDELPSPYLSGVLDKFFDRVRFTPLLQATRGCPFTCTFCWASNEVNRRIGFFSLERVEAELRYISEAVKWNGTYDLVFCDSNFGLYQKDWTIVEMIAELQRTHGYPRIFRSPFGKEVGPDAVYRVSKLDGVTFTLSMQSTNENILAGVKRTKWDLDAIRDCIAAAHELNHPVDTEIIVGLPNETRATHMQTIRDVLDCGFDRVYPFTFMLLDGTELETEEAQRKYSYDVRYRLIPRNFGLVAGQPSFELERVVVGTDTYSFEDYLFFRTFHVLLNILLNHGVYDELIRFLREHGVHPLDWLLFVYDDLRQRTDTEASRTFAKFIDEARAELWDSPEAFVENYSRPEEYEKLLRRERGDNLMQKCTVLASSIYFETFAAYLIGMARTYLDSVDREVDGELDDIANVLRARLAGVIAKDVHQTSTITLRHDVLAWRDHGFARPLASYRLAEPKTVALALSDQQVSLIRNIFDRYHVDEEKPTTLFRSTVLVGIEHYFRKFVATA